MLHSQHQKILTIKLGILKQEDSSEASLGKLSDTYLQKNPRKSKNYNITHCLVITKQICIYSAF